MQTVGQEPAREMKAHETGDVGDKNGLARVVLSQQLAPFRDPFALVTVGRP